MPRSRSSATGDLQLTLEEFEYDGLKDDRGVPFSDLLNVEVSIDYEIDEYDPGVMYDRDGGGCPPSGGGVGVRTIKVKSALRIPEQGADIPLTPSEIVLLQAEVNRRYEKVSKFADWIRER